MDKRWVYRPRQQEEAVSQLAAAINVDPLIARLLIGRGVSTFEAAKDFFRPELANLHDPFLMKDMGKAVDIIEQAIRNQDKILIYGDYDVDGTTAVAVTYRFFKHIYEQVGYYIPDRHSEGYGVSMQAIDWAVENEYKLIITLDCGITANEQVAYANSLGLTVIITDHHLPAELPDAAAILNPKQHDCPYPFKDLSGCGIGFKLTQAFSLRHEIDPEFIYQTLDLLAVSIAADIVPILGENRILTHFGLKKLNENPTMGLRAIIQLCCDKKELTITDIVFTIAPRINAAGRMGDAKNAVELLLSPNMQEAESRAQTINETNTDRRDVDANITREAILVAEAHEDFLSRKTTVVYGPNWHKGVIGIVASRLVEQYYRPTIVFSHSDGFLTGSARSVNGFDIHDAISQCAELVDQFGGHKYAAGLTLREENIEAFSKKFEMVVSRSIREEQLVPVLEIDQEIQLKDINSRFFRVLKQFAPFGPGNMQPIFTAKMVFSNGFVRVVGENHLQISVQQDGSVAFSAIAFGHAEHYPLISKGIPFNIAFTIEENTWRGVTSIKLNIKDIKFD
ncbi:MAG: single-stranded-DNA-specific exonuclease RecJ [Sphingobacteriaceae bacterium]|nr:single-stranded-DNA-specific exonuclease RecJ [Sphingobacteriaceae bacterium]